MKLLKAYWHEERPYRGKVVRVTVFEPKPAPAEELEQRLAALEARVAELEQKVGKAR